MFQSAMILLLAGGMVSQNTDAYESALVAAIHHFAREGELEHLRAIVERHPRLVDVRETFVPSRKPDGTSGYTPLDWAADRGHSAVADYLIRRGADVNAAYGAGWRPLHVAAREGHLEIVKLLVARGADVKARTDEIPETTSDSLPGAPPREPGKETEPPVKIPGIPSRTALEWAAAMKHRQVVEYLRLLK